MPPVALPDDVWSRIVSFVAPPLPYVGLEHESVAEDAKDGRDELEVKGTWKDIDSFMLVSRHVHELVHPIFWSYLVLLSPERATALATRLGRRPEEHQSRILNMVKVFVLAPFDGPADDKTRAVGDHPYLSFLRQLHHVHHVHVRPATLTPTSPRLLVSLATRMPPMAPLQGLSGLFLGATNFEAAMVALRHLAPSLRQLSIYTLETNPPPSLRHTVKSITFPALVSLSLETLTDPDRPGLEDEVAKPWLEDELGSSWHLPQVNKLALGVAPRWALGSRGAAKHDSLYTGDLEAASQTFASLEDLGVRELGFSIMPESTVTLLSLAEFKNDLDEAEDEQVRTIEVVVVVCQKYVEHHKTTLQDRCLAELVSRKRMPALKKVVWVLAGGKDNENRDESPTSGALGKRRRGLVEAGVEFELL